MSKAKAAKMKGFKIISLDYKMEPGYEGNLSVEQQIQFNLPTSKEKTIFHGEFELKITGDGEKEFHFNIVGRGTFEVEPEQMEDVMKMEQSLMDPMVDEMGNRLIKVVADTTALFGIPSIELKTVDTKENKN